MNGEKNWMAFAIGVIGLFTALITNLDRVADLFHEVFDTPNVSHIGGEWMAIIREYSPKDGKENTSKEFLDLTSRGSKILGKDRNVDNSRRWNLSGFYKNSVLVLNYVDQIETSKSIGSYVAEANPDGKTFKGYWLGYDRDLKMMVACALILTKENASNVETAHRDYLERPCYKWTPSPLVDPVR